MINLITRSKKICRMGRSLKICGTIHWMKWKDFCDDVPLHLLRWQWKDFAFIHVQCWLRHVVCFWLCQILFWPVCGCALIIDYVCLSVTFSHLFKLCSGVYLLLVFIICSIETVLTVVSCQIHSYHAKGYRPGPRTQTLVSQFAKLACYRYVTFWKTGIDQQ